MNWHSTTAEEALKNLKSGPEGLTSAEVDLRRKQYGLNEIPEKGDRHWILTLIRQFKSLLVLVLLAASIISWMMGHKVDMYAILAVIIINAAIGFVQELRAGKAVASLKSILVIVAKVLRNGDKITLPAAELVPGDIVVLEEGDSVPADLRLIEAKNLRAIEAPLTGESVPVNKHTEPLPDPTPLADQKNMLFKGTFIAGGYGLAVVTGTGMNTAIGEIAKTLGQIKITKTSFQRKTDILARQMAIIAIVSAAILFVVAYMFQETEPGEILLISLAALVAAIPEGLPAVLSIVLSIGARRMSKRNAIIREFTATETLGAITTIITDKTGTLTQNTLTVHKVSILNEGEWTVTGEGWLPVGNFTMGGHIIEVTENHSLCQLLRIAAWSNNSDIRHLSEKNTHQLIGDPTEGALLVLARKGGFFPKKDLSVKKLDDLPFSSALKLRATLASADGKKQLLVVGAPEKLMERATHISGSNGVQPITDGDVRSIKRTIESWSGEAMRVIALAYREEPSEATTINEADLGGLVFAGLVGMADPPRPGVKESIALCRQAGIRVIMATGDHANTAIAVARSVGIIEGDGGEKTLALTETQLLALDKEEFEDAIMTTDIFARLTPNMKLRIAATLQQRGELIAMTGDGVNDAPALKKADIGIAMGIMGTDVARDAAKMVLADDNFSTIVSAVEEGRIVFTNARQTSFFLVTTNFAEIITLVTAIVIGLPIPLTATQILWLNLVTDGLGDVSLATESGHGEVLKQKPVNPKEKILNKSVLPFLVINAVVMTVLAIGAFAWFLPVGVEKARTAAFIIMAFSQLFNIFNMRSLRLSIFKIGMFTNRYINMGLAVSILTLVMIIELPFFARVFMFAPMSVAELSGLAAVSSMVMWIGEIYKYVKDRQEESGR